MVPRTRSVYDVGRGQRRFTVFGFRSCLKGDPQPADNREDSFGEPSHCPETEEWAILGFGFNDSWVEAKTERTQCSHRQDGCAVDDSMTLAARANS